MRVAKTKRQIVGWLRIKGSYEKIVKFVREQIDAGGVAGRAQGPGALAGERRLPRSGGWGGPRRGMRLALGVVLMEGRGA
jgi:hypothetical protein